MIRREGRGAGWVLLLLVLPACGAAVAAEEPGAESVAESAAPMAPRGDTYIPFPFYFYTPETKSGGGASLSVYLRSDNAAAATRPTRIGVICIVTARSQYMTGVSLESYPDDERYRLDVGISASEFPTTFFGVGPDTDRDHSEDYTPRGFGFEAGLYRRIGENLRTGPRIRFRRERIVESEPGGWFDRDVFNGSDGGTMFALGWSLRRDSRDNVMYPVTGVLDELTFELSDGVLGADFDYAAATLDLRRYRELGKRAVLAARLRASHITGRPPLQMLNALGGQNLLRGYYEGRFRDRSLYALQLEYRRDTWWRTGLTVFGALGDVAHRPAGFRLDSIKSVYGVGLRMQLSTREKANLRFDLGRTDEGETGFYMGFAEAF